MKRLSTDTNVKNAIAPNVGSVGQPTANVIDATGFNRARFIFSFGANSGTSAALSSGAGIWKSATSGGTYTAVSGGSLAAVSSGVLSENVMIIDTVVDGAKPFLKVSGMSILSTAIENSCVVELYRATSVPATQTAQQVVIVN